MLKHKRFCLIISISLLGFIADGQTCQQLTYAADSLYKLKQYNSVIILLERVSFFNCKENYLRNLANAYLETGEYQKATIAFKKEWEEQKVQDQKTEAFFGLIKSYIQSESYENALELLNIEYKKNHEDSALKKRLEFYYFLTYWKSNQNDSAEKWSGVYFASSPEKKEKAQAYYTAYRESRKIPKLALAFNLVLPGTGFVYTKHYKKGIQAFALNGVLAASTIYTAGQYYPAYALVAVGSWWIRYYAGGAVNGYNSAVYYNRNEKDKWKDKIFTLMTE